MNPLRYTNYSSSGNDQSKVKSFDNIQQGIQQEHSGVSQVQRDLAVKLTELDKKGKDFLSPITMRGKDRALLKKLDNARLEAADIILSSRNQSLKVVAETSVRYSKSLANVIMETLETGNMVALESNFMEAKLRLINKLESLNNEFLEIMNRKEEQIKIASELIKPMLQDQAYLQLSCWMDDFDLIIKQFSSIRERRFK